MSNEKPFVWILDDEWTDHHVEDAIYRTNGFDVKVTRSEKLAEDLPLYAPRADGLVVQVGFPCTTDLIERLESCKVISASAVGYNHIDVKAATDKGIIVCHVPDYCAEEVSDHAVALMLAVTRRFPAYTKQVKEGKWDPLNTLPIHRFRDHTVGLLGFGRIAQAVARKLKPFGVRLIACDDYIAQDIFAENGVESVSFHSLLQQSTILSLHVPLTPDTVNLIRYEQLKRMPQGAFVINTCRGGIIHEGDLLRAIREGHIAGAGLDVLAKEPPDPSEPLLSSDLVLITPHAAYISEEAVLELKQKTCQNIIDGVRGIPSPYMLNHR